MSVSPELLAGSGKFQGGVFKEVFLEPECLENEIARLWVLLSEQCKTLHVSRVLLKQVIHMSLLPNITKTFRARIKSYSNRTRYFGFDCVINLETIVFIIAKFIFLFNGQAPELQFWKSTSWPSYYVSTPLQPKAPSSCAPSSPSLLPSSPTAPLCLFDTAFLSASFLGADRARSFFFAGGGGGAWAACQALQTEQFAEGLVMTPLFRQGACRPSATECRSPSQASYTLHFTISLKIL